MCDSYSERRGRLITIPPFAKNSPASVTNAKEASLKVNGPRLFNLLPRDIRDMSGSVDSFKNALDNWLMNIPDQPTIQGRQRAAATNSLRDQVTYAAEANN